VLPAALVVDELVDVEDQVLHVGALLVELVHVLVVARGGDQVGQVQAALARERGPEHARHVEEEGLQQQHERHPLVVLDLAFLALDLLFGNGGVRRHVIGVLNPADLGHVLLVDD